MKVTRKHAKYLSVSKEEPVSSVKLEQKQPNIEEFFSPAAQQRPQVPKEASGAAAPAKGNAEYVNFF